MTTDDLAQFCPPWTAGLPRLRLRPERPRRYECLPTPAMAYTGDTTRDWRRALVLGLRRRCSICGCALGAPVYSVLMEFPQDSWLARPDGIWLSTRHPGAMHRSCAFFSALVCPILRHAKSRTRLQTQMTQYRRGRAAIVGFTDYRALPLNDGLSLGVLYRDLAEFIEFDSAAELVPLYNDVVAADAPVIDQSTRLYWRDDRPFDMARLDLAAAATPV
jgi:hypothetical protein